MVKDTARVNDLNLRAFNRNVQDLRSNVQPTDAGASDDSAMFMYRIILVQKTYALSNSQQLLHHVKSLYNLLDTKIGNHNIKTLKNYFRK